MDSPGLTKEVKRERRRGGQEPTDVRGIIMPSRWDRNGTPTDLMIAAFDENEYHIEKDAIGAGLIDCLRKEVLAKGRLQEKSGKKWIKIIEYQTAK